MAGVAASVAVEVNVRAAQRPIAAISSSPSRAHMSVPRIAIHRPVTMFMLSAVIVMLGAISLTKLPVDLMPEFAAPVITVNTTYANVGPLEIEELITRPIEQSVSAVAGITRVESSS